MLSPKKKLPSKTKVQSVTIRQSVDEFDELPATLAFMLRQNKQWARETTAASEALHATLNEPIDDSDLDFKRQLDMSKLRSIR
jgi:hypothetical protein